LDRPSYKLEVLNPQTGETGLLCACSDEDECRQLLDRQTDGWKKTAEICPRITVSDLGDHTIEVRKDGEVTVVYRLKAL
jgi:hypothetical protein